MPAPPDAPRSAPPATAPTTEAAGGAEAGAPAPAAAARHRPHLGDLLNARRERLLFVLLGFVVTLAVARLTTGFILWRSDGEGGGIVVAGVHLHHYMWGLALVLGVGLAWAAQLGVGEAGSPWASRLTAAAFGVGAALILDEFALLLHLEDVYWAEEGHSSFQAMAVGGGVLLAAWLAAPYEKAQVHHQRERRAERRAGRDAVGA